MYGFCKIFYQLLEAMDLEGGAHDDEHVGFAGDISRLNSADVIAERVGFIIKNDCRAEGANPNRPSRTGCTSLSWWGCVLVWMRQ